MIEDYGAITKEVYPYAKQKYIILYILTAIMYPLWGLAFNIVYPSFYDPLILRFSVAIVYFASGIFLQTLDTIKVHSGKLLYLCFTIIMAHLSYVTSVNNMHHYYQNGFVLMVFLGTSIIEEQPGLIWFMILMLSSALLTSFAAPNFDTQLIFLTLVFTTLAFSLAAVYSRLKSEEARNRKEGFCRYLIKALPDQLMIIKNDGTIIFCEESSQNQNADPDTKSYMVGSKIQKIFPYDVGNEITSALQKITISNPKGGESLEFSININAQKQFFEARLLPMKKDEILVIIRDVSIKRQVEEEISLQNELLDEMSKMANIGCWQYDLIHDQANFSDQCYLIHEIEKGNEITLTHILSYYDDEVRRDLRSRLTELIKNGTEVDAELNFVTPKGNLKFIRFLAKRNIKNAQVVLSAVLQDVTSSKRDRERADYKSRMTSLGRLASEISQEIKNPLAVIKANADYVATKIENAGDDKKLIQSSQRISETVDKINNIIFDLQLFSEEPRNIPFEIMSVKAIISNVAQFSAEKFSASNTQFNIKHPIDRNIFIKSQRGQVDNAILIIIEHIHQIMGVTHHKKKEISLFLSVDDKVIAIHIEYEATNPQLNFDSPGLISEDTSMSLGLAKSIIDLQGGFLKSSTTSDGDYRITLSFPIISNSEEASIV